MQRELKLLQREVGITFIFVTHDQSEALAISDRVVLLHHGKMEQCGTPRAIYSTPRTAYAASFLGKSNLVRGQCSREWRIAGLSPCRSSCQMALSPFPCARSASSLRLKLRVSSGAICRRSGCRTVSRG